MRVSINEKDRHGVTLFQRLVLCETHAREMATRLKARWPEAHEASATTHPDGDRRAGSTTIRVMRGVTDEDYPCDLCGPVV